MIKDAREMRTKPGSHVHWIKLAIAIVTLIAISFAFSALLQLLKSKLDIDLFEFAVLAYVSVFIASLLANATVIAPVPFAVAVMITAARDFNPVLVALCGATGGMIGELGGYYAGRLGKKIAIPDTIVGYQRIERWINKYGFWAITLLSLQPIIPFDVGGLIAGLTRMPLIKFLPALWIGKFPKYLLFIYAGLGLINFLPSWLVG